MITTLIGTIEQRLLINYRVDPDVMAARLPPPFTPSLVAGHAIAGICLTQLRVRPRWAPRRPPSVRFRHSWHRAAPPSSIDLVQTGRGDLGSVDGRPTSLG